MEKQIIKLGDKDIAEYIEFSIESENVLSKLIEMISLGLSEKLLIKQVDGYVIITDMSSHNHKDHAHRAIGFERYIGKMCDDNEAVCKYTYFGNAGALIESILENIDMCDMSIMDDDCCEMSWIDEIGLHIMVSYDCSIAISKSTKEAYYDTYVDSKCVVGNSKYKEFNCYVCPNYEDEGWDEYLVSYNENNPILSTAVLVRNQCECVNAGHDYIHYFIDENGKPLMAFESNVRCKDTMMSNTFRRMTPYDPNGETLYRIGDEDDYDMYGHIIVLHYNPKGETYAEHVYKDEFYEMYGY